MLQYKDVEVVSAQDIVDEIAKRLDPLAFENVDIADMAGRRERVYVRISNAYMEWRRRETDMTTTRPVFRTQTSTFEETTMNEDQCKELRDRCIKALRNARDERRETHSILSHYMNETLPIQTVQDARDVIAMTDQARARNMLLTETQRYSGSCDTEAIEMAATKRRDKYIKSPSVRASRKAGRPI